MTVIIEGISFDALLRARERFEQFRKHLNTDQDKAGAIKAFEYTYESAWKSMKRLVDVRGGIPFPINGLRDVFRAAAYINMIKDPKVWFKFVEARNITAHVYNEDDADEVIAVFDDFSRELTLFLKNIGIVQ